MPIFWDNSNIAVWTSSSVSLPLIISTNFITGTGLKKCIPITLPGFFDFAAISVIDNDDVLVDNIALSLATASMSANITCFVAISSATASMNKSASEHSSYLVVFVILANISSILACSILPFATIFPRPLPIVASKVSNVFPALPLTITGNPAWANVCTIPFAIVPVPTTQIFLTSILSSNYFYHLHNIIITSSESIIKWFS